MAASEINADGQDWLIRMLSEEVTLHAVPTYFFFVTSLSLGCFNDTLQVLQPASIPTLVSIVSRQASVMNMVLYLSCECKLSSVLYSSHVQSHWQDESTMFCLCSRPTVTHQDELGCMFSTVIVFWWCICLALPVINWKKMNKITVCNLLVPHLSKYA